MTGTECANALARLLIRKADAGLWAVPGVGRQYARGYADALHEAAGLVLELAGQLRVAEPISDEEARP